jgi:hypothetical protein
MHYFILRERIKTWANSVRDGGVGFHKKESSRDFLRYADDWIGCAEICVEDKKCDDKDHKKERREAGKSVKSYTQIETGKP